MTTVGLPGTGLSYSQVTGGNGVGRIPQKLTREPAIPGEAFNDSPDDLLTHLNNPPGNWIARLLGRTPPLELTYAPEGNDGEYFALLQQALTSLSSAGSLWLVAQKKTTKDLEQKGGAGSSGTPEPVNLDETVFCGN